MRKKRRQKESHSKRASGRGRRADRDKRHGHDDGAGGDRDYDVGDAGVGVGARRELAQQRRAEGIDVKGCHVAGDCKVGAHCDDVACAWEGTVGEAEKTRSEGGGDTVRLAAETDLGSPAVVAGAAGAAARAACRWC